jgi:hypothetical protein
MHGQKNINLNNEVGHSEVPGIRLLQENSQSALRRNTEFSHSAHNLKHEGVHFFTDLFVADGSAILLSLYEQVQECQPSLRS